MKTAVHFSSATDEWETPQDLFDRLNKEFDLTVDVCATKENTKLPHFYTKAMDGLSYDWKNFGGRCWMNPPYGREIGKWVEKAATGGAAVVVALLPARTDTRWWHDFIQDKAEVRFIKGRLKFGGYKNSAPFPSAIVIFRPLPKT
jgi:phage N-6-adenine-methyltransferase